MSARERLQVPLLREVLGSWHSIRDRDYRKNNFVFSYARYPNRSGKLLLPFSVRADDVTWLKSFVACVPCCARTGLGAKTILPLSDLLSFTEE